MQEIQQRKHKLEYFSKTLPLIMIEKYLESNRSQNQLDAFAEILLNKSTNYDGTWQLNARIYAELFKHINISYEKAIDKTPFKASHWYIKYRSIGTSNSNLIKLLTTTNDYPRQEILQELIQDVNTGIIRESVFRCHL